MSHIIKRVLFAGPWWHEELMKGVARHSAAQGWHINLEPALSGELPDAWHGDGIITMLGGGREQFERFWARVSCPAVSLSLNYPQMQIPRVGIDNEQAGRIAAEHFLERGYTSFGFFDRADQHAGQQRCDAFAQRLADADHTVMRVSIPEDAKEAGGWFARQQALQTMLQQVPKPVAVFAADDACGVEVIEACQSLQLDVPHQVGVLGMLDMPLFRQSTTIPMSSIMIDFDSQTRIACELLASLMAGGAPPDQPILIPPTGIAMRASTDVIVARHPAVSKAIRFMMEHFPQLIEVPQIVAASGMSQTRLYAAFAKDLGQSPGAVLTRIRIEKARQMLINTREKIDAIAHACGFGNRINLYRLFRQHTGVSPGAFRKQAARRQSHAAGTMTP